MIADLREATADLALDAPSPGLPELKLAAATTPSLTRQFLALHRAYRALDERMLRFDETVRIRTEDAPDSLIPYQEVRDFFHYRDNYVDELDVAAEALAEQIGIDRQRRRGPGARTRAARPVRHSRRARARADPGFIRRYDATAKVVTLVAISPNRRARSSWRRSCADLLFGEIVRRRCSRRRARNRPRLATSRASVSAITRPGALLMPYRQFAASAMRLRHDIEQLQHRYTASFEQVSHRLSTLQRPGARGIPFYFVRVDQAGNITKRHSSTRFQFARFGGACPLWNVHEAFGNPGRILVQVAEMPDGVRYLCVGRSIIKRSGDYLQPESPLRDRHRLRNRARRQGGLFRRPAARWRRRCRSASVAGSANDRIAINARFRRWHASSPCMRTNGASCRYEIG